MVEIIKKHIKDAFLPHEKNDYKPRALRNKALGVYSVIIIAIKVSFILLTALLPSIAELSTISANELTNITNNTRNSNGLNTLSVNSTLISAAEMKASDMFEDGYFGHIAPDGKSDWWFFRQAGYNYAFAGANLALDFDTSQSVFDAWMTSPSHKENILNGEYKEIGIAVVNGNYQGRQTVIVVQFFGTPQASQPEPSPQPTPQPEPTPTPSPEESTPPEETTPPTETQPEEPTYSPAKDTTPPAKPAITKPSNNSIFSRNYLRIIGDAESYSKVSIFDHEKIIKYIDANSSGKFSTLLEKLTDGIHLFSITAKDNANNESEKSNSVKVTIDTTAPEIKDNSYVTPSAISPDLLDIFVYTSDDVTDVKVSTGEETKKLTLIDDKFTGTIKKPAGPTSVLEIKITATDKAGHITEKTIAMIPKETPQSPTTTSAGTSIIGGSEGVIGNLTANKKVMQIATYIFIAIIVILTILLFINIFVKIKKQHPPTIIMTLLVIILAGVMLLI